MPRKIKILFLSQWFPIPTNNGSKLRIYNLLKGLAKHYDVSLISFDESLNTEHHPNEIQSLCTDVKTIPIKTYNLNSLQAKLGLLSLTPRNFIGAYSPEMAQAIQKAISAQKPDLVIASQLGTALYRRIFTSTPAIFEEVETGLFYDRYINAPTYSRKLRNGLTWVKHRRYLQNILRGYQVCTVVSDRENQLLSKINPDHTAVAIIPNCINIDDYQAVKEKPQPDTLIFTGSFNYYPNYEGLVWFLEKVYPQVQASCPTIKLLITGDNANRPIPPASNVTLTGFVEDIRPLIAESSISIAPLLSGGGTRLKILEAMALHTPVVTTRKGAEGLDLKHGSNIFIADTPDEFACQIIKLLKEPELRQKLANNAYQLVRDKYEWSVVMPRFINIVEETVSRNKPGIN